MALYPKEKLNDQYLVGYLGELILEEITISLIEKALRRGSEVTKTA